MITGPEVEAWATFEWSPEAWSEFLIDSGVDRSARQELFLLAQLSKRAGNDVIWKLIKKNSDGQFINNPSGFVHTACKNWMHKL